MVWAAVAVGVGSMVVGAYSANEAQNAQSEAAANATAAQRETTTQTLAQQQKMYDENVARMAPYTESGKGALAQLQAGTQAGGQFMQKFDGSNFQQDPSYQFRLQQGMKALQASGAARGTAGGTQGMRDITNYAQGAASNEYQAAYGRFQDQQNTLFNRLSTVAGNSQNAAAGLGAQGTQVSSNMANTAMQGTQAANNFMIGGANAAAAGQVGMANAVTGGLSSGMNAYMSQQYLNKLNQPTSTGPVAGQNGYSYDYTGAGASMGPQMPTPD